ncbi:hypothetical protein AB9K26_07630 [Psychroserpens sp. XS_ASV72]|uniref:hypothetical protein n=1 Tax=Psychroserpens sp. XS_ASV72 TaxID=3241293 RepID=UPI0035160649
MQRLLPFFILFLVTSNLSSQNLKGKVYDAESTVKGALVVNISQNIMTYTNDEGDFSISAQIKDTLYVSSLFHTKALVAIKASDFEDIMIIEVKKAINELDAVLLRDEREKQFDTIRFNTQVKNQIAEDIKRNPWKYGHQPSGNIDFVAIAKMIGKLFKKKRKKELFTPISYKRMDSLFSKSNFFNKTLLMVDLNIPEDYHYLFFDYLETKNIDTKLLDSKKQMELLEEIVVASQEFHNIIEEAKKDH